jgi:hypothetical protein
MMLIESELGTPTELQMLSAANYFTGVQKALYVAELEYFNYSGDDDARETLQAQIVMLKVEQAEKIAALKTAIIAHTESIKVHTANYEPLTLGQKLRGTIGNATMASGMRPKFTLAATGTASPTAGAATPATPRSGAPPPAQPDTSSIPPWKRELDARKNNQQQL